MEAQPPANVCAGIARSARTSIDASSGLPNNCMALLGHSHASLQSLPAPACAADSEPRGSTTRARQEAV
eukprot:4490046-Alexandrium_andersonii.AAC.1